jgi:O-antigen/teichoic acid export membrane protein
MSNRKTIALNTFSQIAGKVITSGTTFIVSILIARSLGASGYGDFTKITTFVAFFYLFADFGLNAAYLELSDDKRAQGNLLALRTLMGLGLMFVCISILAFLPGSSTEGYSPFVKLGIILFSVSILFQGLITTANAYFQKQLRYEYATYALSVGSVVTLLLVCLLPRLRLLGVLPIIVAFALGSFITAAFSLFFTKKLHADFSFSFDVSLIKKMLVIAFPLGLTLLCNVVYFHADSVILTLTKSTYDVGIYGLAYKVFEFPLVVPTFFMNAVFPLLLISQKTGNAPAFIRQIKRSVGILFSLSLVLLIVGYMAAPFLTLIKTDFRASVLPFRILLLSIPVFYITSVTMWTLIALKRRMQLFFIYFVSMIVNVGCGIAFIPQYGYIAAAWITVVSEILVLLLSWIVIQKHFHSVG